jgi:Family of unknown function (DUF6527)
MKALPFKFDGVKTYSPCAPEEATHLRFKIPDRGQFFGCNMLPVQTKGTRAGTGNWSWNGDVDKPTLKPSLVQWHTVNGKEERCHVWITDGRVQFLSDCTHELRGQTVDLEDIEE